VGSLFKSSGGSEAAGGAWDWIKSAASSAGSWLGLFAEGTPYVPRTGLAGLHKGERVLTSQQNQDFVSLMAGFVGAEIAQTGLDAQIAASLGQIQVNTGATASGVHGLTGSIQGMTGSIQGMTGSIQGMTGSLGSIVNNALSIAGGGMVALGTGNLGLGLAAGKGIHGLLTSLGIGPAPDPGGKATGLFGPYFDPNTLPGGYGPPGGSDPWGLFNSYDEGGTVDVGGFAEVHAGEVIWNGSQQRAFAGRLDRIEAAVASRPAVSPVFQFVNNGVVTTQDADVWFAERIQQYEDQFSAASQDRIQAVATAGVNI
jgi:hypothetical protein